MTKIHKKLKPKGYCCPMCNGCSRKKANSKKWNKKRVRQRLKKMTRLSLYGEESPDTTEQRSG